MGSKLTLERLNELFRYDREEGRLYWNTRPLSDFKNVRAANTWNGKLAGKPAGSISAGYIKIGIDGKYYAEHRIIWFLETGEWPEEVDHINGVKNDNRFINFRTGSHAENMRNQPMRRSNKSGYPGVLWEKSKNLWVARIPIDGKLTTLGRSKDKHKVIELRQEAERRLGFHENHGRAA